jgi:hypothetical protein
VVLHNRVQWRLSQAHLTFSSSLLLRHSPVDVEIRKDFLRRIFDANQSGHNVLMERHALVMYKMAMENFTQVRHQRMVPIAISCTLTALPDAPRR